MRGVVRRRADWVNVVLTPTSPFHESRWIWPDGCAWDLTNCYALFRKRFELTELPAEAPLFLTADQSYRLFVNGRFVARGPARGFQEHWPYDEIDIRPFLVVGENLLAIRCHHPGRGTFQYVSRDVAGLLVAAQWGGIRSDDTWRGIRQEGISRDAVPSSTQLFSQEHLDLRTETGDWTQLDFDDADWVTPTQRPWNAGPWFSLEPRGIPLLEERDMGPGRLIGENSGQSASGYLRVRDVVALRNREDRSHRPARSSDGILRVEPTGIGTFRSYLVDFGRSVVGNLSIEIEGAAGGEILDTHYAETVADATLTPDLVMPTECRISIGDRLICRPGSMRHHFYHHYGFRYLTLTVRDVTQPLVVRHHLQWTGYPLERSGEFTSSEHQFEDIWKICAWTQQCCALDAYVDTPWREQAQWWGDARVQGWNTFHLSGDTRLFRRGIAQIASQTIPEGLTFGHAPTVSHNCVLPDFTLIWMLTLWDDYWQTGSIETFLAHRDTVRRALDYFRRQTHDGLVAYDPRFWLFLDWTGLLKDRFSSIYNLWLLLTLEKLAELNTLAHAPEEAADLTAWAADLRVALSRLLLPGGLLSDGINPQGQIVASTSLHAQTLALMARLDGLNEDSAIESLILPFVRGESSPEAPPSAYWITYLFDLLEEKGYAHEVVECIRRLWAPMIPHGTTWELFQPERGIQSFSHAWSAHPLHHLMRTLGGLTSTAAGWSSIRFQPLFIGDHCRTALPSPHGPLRTSWQRNDQGVKVCLNLPPGVTAQVHLPGLSTENVVGTRHWQILDSPHTVSGRLSKKVLQSCINFLDEKN